MLYLVATPIGNLADITYRAIETLQTCDYILCEDTRHSAKLLNHYEIKKPLKSFHKFNELSREDEIVHDLDSGKVICLISDAGTPGISDPGTLLVQKCIESGILVTAIPGPCAAIAALSISGLDTAHFQFYGFLPKQAGQLRHSIQQAAASPATTIFYESPHRLIDTLALLQEIDPNRKLVIARELTKKFEEIARGTVGDILAKWKEREILGEIVLMIAGKEEEDSKWEKLTPEEHVSHLQENYKLDRHEAIKMAASMRGVPKRHIYNQLQKKDD